MSKRFSKQHGLGQVQSAPITGRTDEPPELRGIVMQLACELKHASDILSTPRQIVFLGYSLPEDDMQARYILRCGLHNQLDGLLRHDGRAKPTGNAGIVVVDPSTAAAERIAHIANRGTSVTHHQMTVETWLKTNPS
jgi:hypothetical protein